MNLSLDKYCVNYNSTIKDAMKVIDKNLIGAAFVIDDESRVIGVVTDGDIRRAILKGYQISENIDGIYNKRFKYANKFESKRKITEYMLENKIRQLPIVDNNNRLVDLCLLDDLLRYGKKDNYVFILAGGLGTRLRPLTENMPKPMLKVGDKPILEIIIDQFKEYGFSKFIISLNYMGEIIENYFKDGRDFGVKIEYVRETKKLGTAGSITLAREKLTKPFVVINGDILTGMDYDLFFNYHIENKYDVTVGVRNYELKIPYGVMVTDESLIRSIEEKPIYNFHINSGVYVLNPDVIKYIPHNEFYDMTDVINDVIKDSKKAGIYTITEYWTDIGRMGDFKKANEDIKKFF